MNTIQKLLVLPLGLLALGSVALSQSESAWKPHLEILNQEPKKSQESIEHSHTLKTDLLRVNQLELKHLQKFWKNTADKMKFKDDEERSKKKSSFVSREVNAHNMKTMRALKFIRYANSGEMKTSQQVIDRVNSHPVTGLDGIMKYPKAKETGYTVERAMYAHYLLLSMGVPQSQIAKIWAVGDLTIDEQKRSFHVAMIIRERRHGFLVIDPLQEKPLPYTQWIRISRDYADASSRSKVRIYITDPRKYQASSGMYQGDLFEAGHSQRFLNDLVKTLPAKVL